MLDDAKYEKILQNLANIATIIAAVSPIITVIIRHWLKESWKEKFNWILGVSILAFIFAVWRFGWLKWINYSFHLPVWILILAFLAAICIGFLISIILYRYYVNGSRSDLPIFFECYGARWEIKHAHLSETPLCNKCLMEMRYEILTRGIPGVGSSIETWTCRECGYKISWDREEHGNDSLIEDVRVRYNASIRKKNMV